MPFTYSYFILLNLWRQIISFLTLSPHFPSFQLSHSQYPCLWRSSSDNFYTKFGTRKLVPAFFHTFSSLYNIFVIFALSHTSSHVNSFSSPYYIRPLISFSFHTYIISSYFTAPNYFPSLHSPVFFPLSLFFAFDGFSLQCTVRYCFSRFFAPNHSFLSIFSLHLPQLTFLSTLSAMYRSISLYNFHKLLFHFKFVSPTSSFYQLSFFLFLPRDIIFLSLSLFLSSFPVLPFSYHFFYMKKFCSWRIR